MQCPNNHSALNVVASGCFSLVVYKLDRSQLRIFRFSTLQIALNQLVIDGTKYNETRKTAGHRGLVSLDHC